MDSRARIAAALLVLQAAPLVSPAAATPPPYSYVATNCKNSYYFVPTLAASVRPEVPARFTILGEPVGLAIVGVLFTTCDVSLNGGAAQPTSWSDVGVLIAPPQGLNPDSVVIDAYRTWSLADRAEMVALNAAWGIPTAEVDVHTVFSPGLPLTTTAGHVDDPSGAYAGQGYFEGIVHPGAPGTVSWWSVGSAGLIRFDQAYTNDTEQCGIGVVTAEGHLGAMIGGTGLGIHGCVVFADLIGAAAVVEPAP